MVSLVNRTAQFFSVFFYKFVLSLNSFRLFGKNRLNILVYHRVLRSYDQLQPDYVTVTQFDKEMQWLSIYFNVLPLSEAVKLLKINKLPLRAVAVTFDDGYADNYIDALPILQNYKVPATFYVTTEYLCETPKWDLFIESIRITNKQFVLLNQTKYSLITQEDKAFFCKVAIDYLKSLEQNLFESELKNIVLDLGEIKSLDLMMDEKLLKLLSQYNGVEIGAHGVHHKILSKVDINEARNEIVNSKNILESLLSEKINSIAYPNGMYPDDFSDEHMDIVKESGFSYAVSANLGSVGCSDNIYRMNRIGPWRRNKFGFLIGLAVNYWRESG